MEFFKKHTQIDFMALRRSAMLFSLALFVFSTLALWSQGLNLGLDFTGGTQIELHYQGIAPIETIRHTLKQAHFKEAVVQAYGSSSDVMIKMPPQGMDNTSLKNSIQDHLPQASISRVEFIGPQVGHALLNNGILAVFISLLATMAYIALRFEYRFAISAAISLIHDPVLIMGVFALFHIEFNLISLAALLTILGYSLNDTIVVYDRVRENFRNDKKSPVEKVVNLAINQTLSRTIMTSGLTLIVVVALCLLGGETLRGFSIALIVGIVIGTYSSIYVAGSLAVHFGLKRDALLKPLRHKLEGTVS